MDGFGVGTGGLKASTMLLKAQSLHRRMFLLCKGNP